MLLVTRLAHWLLRTCACSGADMAWSLLVFVVVLVAVRLVQLYREQRRLPPGPWGLPVLGYLPFLKGDLHQQYKELSDKYGPMFSARLGRQTIVVLGDHKTIREAFRKEEFTARPQTEFSAILGGYGECPRVQCLAIAVQCD